MPLFTYICPNDHQEDCVYLIKQRRPKKRTCPKCGKNSSRLFTTQQVITMQPYVTYAADGIRTEISTPNEERAYERKHGVAHLTDDDMKDISQNTGRQKDRLRRIALSKLTDEKDSYEQAVAECSAMGGEFLREQQDRERFEMADAIDE